MGYSKEQARSVKHAVLTGDEQRSQTISSTNTVVIFDLTGPSSMTTVCSDTNLAYTVDYSCNGINFFGATSGTAGVPVTQNSNVIAVVRITWVSGSGTCTMLAA